MIDQVLYCRTKRFPSVGLAYRQPTTHNPQPGVHMLTVGDKFPQFNLKATVSIDSVEKAFAPIDNNTYKGKWLLVFFYPKDFTFVCPTEIKGFGDLNNQFLDRDCQVLAASTDSEFVHLAWRKDHKDLRHLPFPMLADTAKRLSGALGILDTEEGVAKRA